jgi:hypothetical protein
MSRDSTGHGLLLSKEHSPSLLFCTQAALHPEGPRPFGQKVYMYMQNFCPASGQNINKYVGTKLANAKSVPGFWHDICRAEGRATGQNIYK